MVVTFLQISKLSSRTVYVHESLRVGKGLSKETLPFLWVLLGKKTSLSCLSEGNIHDVGLMS